MFYKYCYVIEVLVLVPFLFTLAACHEAVNPILGDQGHREVEHEHDTVRLTAPDGSPSVNFEFDSSVVHNKEHIHEHLDGYVKSQDEMTDEELQFHYFKLHDSNNDNELDGTELLQAFLHEHKEDKDNPTPTSDGDSHNKNINFDHIVRNVDFLLEQYDKNNDGRVSYPEFISSLKSHELKPPPPPPTTQQPPPQQQDL